MTQLCRYGDYDLAFYLAASLCVVAALMCLCVRKAPAEAVAAAQPAQAQKQPPPKCPVRAVACFALTIGGVKIGTGKKLGSAVAITAIALATAVTAHGDPATVPDPQGPGCGAYKEANPIGAGSLTGMAAGPVTTAIANNPQLTTFNAAISGQLNPAVNIVSVLDNGPYVVFAPVDEAFAKVPPEQLDALKADPAALTGVLFYHMVLGILGPEDVHGQLTAQQGTQITVEGKGGDIKVDGAKVICGGIVAGNARIYMIDTVLDPAGALPSTATVTPTTTTTPETTAPPAAEVPAEAPAEAPAA